MLSTYCGPCSGRDALCHPVADASVGTSEPAIKDPLTKARRLGKSHIIITVYFILHNLTPYTEYYVACGWWVTKRSDSLSCERTLGLTLSFDR